ncbi:MAG: DUF308 domain-containing protein [Bacilli bacterium]
MLKKEVKAITLLLSGIISIILGILIICNGIKILKLVTYLISIQLILNGLFNALLPIFKKHKKYKALDIIIKAAINIIFGLIIIFFNNYVLAIITLIFALYILLIALVNFISFIMYKINNIKGKFNLFLNFVINLLFAIILTINPYMHIKYVLIILGVYLLLYGFKRILNFVTEIMPQKTRNKIKNNIEIPLPLLLAMILPKALIRSINEMLKVDTPEEYNFEKISQKPDLFVIIHLAKTGTASFGHMEIAYKDKIYSYGNYNKYSRKIFEAIGDGVILIANKDKYIDYCVNKKERFLVEFGIALTNEQKVDVEKRINQLINENTIDYYSDLELYEKGELDKTDFKDMSSEIYKYADGKYKKIINGKNKIFFVLKNNCAVVSQYILKGTGKSVISLNGIVSPGTYYDYLNSRFMMKNTNVITRKLYAKEKICQNCRK